MRKSLVALAVVLVAGLGAVIPATAPVAHAASTTKVAIIVGATHGTTSTYRSYADSIAAAARRYTSNVVKVYSPNATWSKVKAAVAGASVIVYLGHGNGWPSPYTYDPNYTTKDGFGLNYDANRDGKLSDSELKYYGEPSIRTLKPAPNAVVLLFHLCYASGNSESGAAAPSLSVAKQRVDNYAAAFLQAGARAVIANGHSHADYYIDALFTTRQSIYDYWRNAPDAHDHVSLYDSSRNPGLTFGMDPERAGSYYRSIAGKMSLTTTDVTGADYADTSRDPSTMVVPGNASPAYDGAPVYDSPEALAGGGAPVAALGTGVKVRVESIAEGQAPDGSPVYAVHTDDGIAGLMAGSALVPRDSAVPRLWEVDDGSGSFSPNGDGTGDSYTLALRVSESVSWTLRVLDPGGTELAKATGSGDRPTMTWAPPSAADGTYTWRLRATDAWGNGPLQESGTFRVDTVAPALELADPAPAEPPVISPDGDGVADGISFTADVNENGRLTAAVKREAKTVATASATVGSSTTTVRWDGRIGSGWAPDGDYTVELQAVDGAGNRSDPVARTVTVYSALGYVTASKPVFFPQDLDTMARYVKFGFTLADAATVDWTIQDSAGNVVRSLRSGEAMGPGDVTWRWNGRDDSGAMVKRGTYRSVVTASDGTTSVTRAVAVTADAFLITSSDSTPGRRQRITITARSAERLGTTPRLRVYQPGIRAWSVTMRKVSGRVYRATITLRSSSPGTLRLRVVARDYHARKQASNLYLALH